MECYICNGNMQKVKKDVDTTWKGRTITFRDLAVWVCSSCGEEAFEPDDVSMMQEFVQKTLPGEEYPKVMNVEEAAKFLRVSTQTVYNLVKAGKLPAAKVGREWRFIQKHLMSFMKNVKGKTSSTAKVTHRIFTIKSGGERHPIKCEYVALPPAESNHVGKRIRKNHKDEAHIIDA